MENIEKEIIKEMAQLLDKMAIESVGPVVGGTVSESFASNIPDLETVLVNLKSVNARYDKREAVTHVKALMSRYNIQVDELLEKIIY